MIKFATFCKLHRTDSLEAFVASVRTPFIYVESLARHDGQSSRGFATVRNSPNAAAQNHDDARLLPIAKRGGANAFGMMVTLGRAPNNDVVIPDQRISKFHAYFRQDADGIWTLADANSSNGTALNGTPLTPQTSMPLESGASITLSDEVELVFVEPQDLYVMVLRG